MKSFILLLLLSCFSRHAFATEAIEAPANLRYESVSAQLDPSPETALRLYELAKIANLEVVTERVFSSKDFKRAILVSMRSLNTKYLGVMLRHSGGLSVFQRIAQEDVALYFIGFQDKEVAKILTDFSAVYSAQVSGATRVPAGEVVRGNSPSTGNFNENEIARIWNTTRDCLGGPIGVVEAATIGPFVSAKKSLKGLSEIGWDKYWENSKRDFESMAAAVLNVREGIKNEISRYKMMPASEQTEYRCALAFQAVALLYLPTSTGLAQTPVTVVKKSTVGRIQSRTSAPPARDVRISQGEQSITPTHSDFGRLYGEADLSKVKKRPEAQVDSPNVINPLSEQWYQSLVVNRNGIPEPLRYQIIEKTNEGMVIIRYSSPRKNGTFETRKVWLESLHVKLKKIEAPPVMNGDFGL